MHTYLNTSNVTVNQIENEDTRNSEVNLNTSNVTVNLQELMQNLFKF